MFRGGTAAATDHSYTLLRCFSYCGGKCVRVDVIAHTAVLGGMGQSGIGLENDRDGGEVNQLPHRGRQLERTCSAVESKSVHTQSFQQRHQGGGITAGEQTAVFAKSRRGQHRQVAAFPSSQYGSFELIKVGHGLDDHRIRSCRCTSPDRFRKGGYRLIKVQISHGSHQVTSGADIHS